MVRLCRFGTREHIGPPSSLDGQRAAFSTTCSILIRQLSIHYEDVCRPNGQIHGFPLPVLLWRPWLVRQLLLLAVSVLTCEIDKLGRDFRAFDLDVRVSRWHIIDKACRSGLNVPQSSFLGLASLLAGLVQS